MARKSRPKRPDKTTIWLSKSTVKRLNEISKRGESYDDVLGRILSGQGEVWVEVLQVDGDSPAKHKVLLKLGEFIYLWNGNGFVPVNPAKVKMVVEGVPAG
jgi:mannose-6-phosphate isomerase-like protein (cupin superfamily)